jgi:hypothetical protein
MSQAGRETTTSRRSFIRAAAVTAVTVPASPVPALAAVAAPVPVFAAIEHHRRIVAPVAQARDDCMEMQESLPDLSEFADPNDPINLGLECKRRSAAHPELDRLQDVVQEWFRMEDMAAEALIAAAATTTVAGAAAVLRYALECSEEDAAESEWDGAFTDIIEQQKLLAALAEALERGAVRHR